MNRPTQNFAQIFRNPRENIIQDREDTTVRFERPATYLINTQNNQINVNNLNNTYTNNELEMKKEMEKEMEIIPIEHFENLANVTSDEICNISNPKEFFESVKCILCNFLSFNPCYTCCCDCIVCRNCITKWTGVNRMCPKCKIPNIRLATVTKFMEKIFKNLKINCRHCKEINVPYLNIIEHERFCMHNPRCLIECLKCKISYEKNVIEFHDCLNELIKSYDGLKKELNVRREQEKDSNDEVMIYLKHSLKLHSHPMIKSTKSTKCSTCNLSTNAYPNSYVCYPCEFYICSKCFESSLSKSAILNTHSHNLEFKIPYGAWKCDICRIDYPNRTYSFRCDSCNYDQCFKCRFA